MESIKARILTSFLVIIATLFIFNVFFFVTQSMIIEKYEEIASDSATEQLNAKIDHFQRLTNRIGGSIFFIILVGCVIYSFTFSRQLVAPLISLTKLAKKIESGDLSATVDQKLLHVFQSRTDLLQGNNEISSLANSFNTMIFSLRSNIEKLREYNAQLIKARQQVASGKLEISQLKELNRMKNEIMNIATHELKTPLISIIGLSEVMQQPGSPLPAEFQQYVSIIHEEGTKLANLIRKMLEAVKEESGKVEITKEKLNLSNLILSLKVPLNTMAKRSDSKVAINIGVKNIKIESNKEKISQVIYNLVDNAVKYGAARQTIKVNLSQPDSKYAKVEISNSGPSIPKERQKKLFLKFSQLEPSLTRSQEGMGLGLYICKQNIESLGGQIGVSSEPNQDTSFYFTLPLG